jgi:glutathione S-transferase
MRDGVIKLYDGRVSPNARKVRLLAAELDIPLERVTLDFKGGEYRSDEYIAKNPNGKIPTIEDDGFVLWESASILRYLAAKRPERGLVPDDPKQRALVDQWLFWWTAHPEPALYLLASERLIKPFLGQGGNDPVIIAEASVLISRFLPVLDRQLANKDYVLGPLSIVDFCAGPWFDAAPLLQVPLDPFPNIGRWLTNLRARPYWKSA